MQWIAAVAICFLGVLPAQAQEDRSKQFDFWLGEWAIEQQIRNQDGSWLEYKATTTVAYILEQHALVEDWQGEVKFFWAGMKESQTVSGYSIRYYNETEGKWFIYWMDSLNPVLSKPYTGTFSKDGHGNFYRMNETPNGTRYSMISFDRESKDKVIWKLAISSDQKRWDTIWIMNMTRE